MSNADRIRLMDDGEMAILLCEVKTDSQFRNHNFPDERKPMDWLKWLEQEFPDEIEPGDWLKWLRQEEM